MTSLKKIGVLALAAFALQACDGFLEDDIVSPNDPIAVTPQLLLANIEVATFATYCGQLTRQSLLFSRQLSGTSAGSQSAEVARYVITEISNTNEWEVIYAGAVVDAKTLINTYGLDAPHYAGIAQVILALNYGVATDLWNAVPTDEAGLGPLVDNQPSYKTQEAVLQDIDALLTAAIENLSVPAEDNGIPVGSDDIIFGGDIAAWLQTAYIIKARYANRLSAIDPTGSANAVLAAVNNPAVQGSDLDAFMQFFGGNAANQWFQFEQDRSGYYRVSEYFANLLIDNGDPRLPFFLSEDENGGYSGTPFDDVSISNSSYVGPVYAGSGSTNVPLVTYVEAKFLEAEANLRLNQNEAAAQAHNEAVIASIEQVTGSSTDSLSQAFIAQFASETGSTITLEKLMIQKYIALFIQIEVYSDWRRTDIPSLEPNPNASTGIPLRLPTVQDERLYNANAIVVSNTQDPVYWDQ